MNHIKVKFHLFSDRDVIYIYIYSQQLSSVIVARNLLRSSSSNTGPNGASTDKTTQVKSVDNKTTNKGRYDESMSSVFLLDSVVQLDDCKCIKLSVT